MGLVMRDAGNVTRQIKSLKMRDAGNVLRTIQTIKMRDAGNVLRTVFSALSASATPETVEGYGSSTSAVAIGTNAATATPAGGLAPFAYLWEAVSAAGWSIGSATAASSTFTSPAVAAFESAVGTFRCRITDAAGTISYTNTINASVTNIGGSGGGGVPIP